MLKRQTALQMPWQVKKFAEISDSRQFRDRKIDRYSN